MTILSIHTVSLFFLLLSNIFVHFLCRKLTDRCIEFRTQTYSNWNSSTGRWWPSCHWKYVEKYIVIVIIIFDLITKLLYFSLRTQVWILYNYACYNHVYFQQNFFSLFFSSHILAHIIDYTRISSYTAWIREHSNDFTFDWGKSRDLDYCENIFLSYILYDMFCKRISESTTIQVSNSFIVISLPNVSHCVIHTFPIKCHK